MDNNDILIRLRYALNIKDTQMIEIFKLGDVVVTEEEMRKLLIRSVEENDVMRHVKENNIACTNEMLESFLNGLIIMKRGKPVLKPGQVPPPSHIITNNKSVNNVLLKKLKIAYGFTSEEMLDILARVGVVITKGELGAVLRKEGHKNYKPCGDRYARNFLKGLTIKAE